MGSSNGRTAAFEAVSRCSTHLPTAYMRRAYKYRVYPTQSQIATLEHHLLWTQRLYNAALEQRRWVHEWNSNIYEHTTDGLYTKVSVAYKMRGTGQSYQLPEVRSSCPELSQISSGVCHSVLQRADRAFSAFFQRCKQGRTPGYPRFKSIDRWDSLIYRSYGSGVRLVRHPSGKMGLKLSDVGTLRIHLDRPTQGVPKTVSIKREGDRWFAVFSCDRVPPRKFQTPVGGAVGIDVGVKVYAALSTGELIENPRWFRTAAENLARKQRALARCKRGSQRRKVAKLQVQRQYAHVANQRQDWQAKLAHRLVCQYDTLVHESLNVTGLLQIGTTGQRKSNADAGWAQFFNMLTYKAEEAGRKVIAVNPAYTSRTCHVCGHRQEMTLADRQFVCEACGLIADRDVNAAKVILARGLASLDGSVRASGDREESAKAPSGAGPPIAVSSVDTHVLCESS